MILLCWNRDNENSWPLEDYEEARQTTDDGWVWSSTWSVGNRINIQLIRSAFSSSKDRSTYAEWSHTELPDPNPNSALTMRIRKRKRTM
jgi:hypothetical protein